MLEKFGFFWATMELCDWSKEGNDDKVLKPVIKYLSEQEDRIIFEFDDLMTELLYDLDTRKLAEQCRKADPLMSEDTFLYSRCAALINGSDYYEKVKRGKERNVWSTEFEALLYVPLKAWALKHKRSADGYPYISPLDYETGSNEDGRK